MINAPSAAEKPAVTASQTIKRQRAMETMSMVSSFISFFVRLRNVGMKNIPPKNQIVRKKMSFRDCVSSSAPANC
jgi:hypothetical protein